MKYVVTITEGGPGEERTFYSGDPFRPFRFVVGKASEPVELTDEQRNALALRGTVKPIEAVEYARPKRAKVEES